MRWQEDVFGPLLERTMENAQVFKLAEEYDLSRESRLARAIVRYVNDTLDAEEKERGVQRVRSGELLIKTGRGPLVLPVRTSEDIARVVAGERWDVVRPDIVDRCRKRYRELYPEARPEKVTKFLRTVWQGRSPRRDRDPSPLWGPRSDRPWADALGGGEPLVKLDTERVNKWIDRSPPRPGHNSETFQKLAHFLGTEAGIPPAVQEPLILSLMSIRARFCPRLSNLGSYQMPLAVMHVNSGRTLWQPTRYQPLAPVVVTTLIASQEGRSLRNGLPDTYEEFLELYGQRMARVLTEAYRQDGLISFAELQWIFLTSTGTVSRAVDYYQRKHAVILPCPGTVLDMGRMLTHKSLVVRLHIQGLSVLEIARQTYHSPRSVDAYLKAFDTVLILHLFGLTPKLMATVMSQGQSLVNEYLDLASKYLKDAETMREHLRSRGVAVPSHA
jgi:hypothetical protein